MEIGILDENWFVDLEVLGVLRIFGVQGLRLGSGGERNHPFGELGQVHRGFSRFDDVVEVVAIHGGRTRRWRADWEKSVKFVLKSWNVLIEIKL